MTTVQVHVVVARYPGLTVRRRCGGPIARVLSAAPIPTKLRISQTAVRHIYLAQCSDYSGEVAHEGTARRDGIRSGIDNRGDISLEPGTTDHRSE